MTSKYNAIYEHGDKNGKMFESSVFYSYPDDKDHRLEIINSLSNDLKDKKSFKILKVVEDPSNLIKYDRLDVEKAIRNICNLNSEIRRSALIGNSQFLNKAYIYFNDIKMYNYVAANSDILKAFAEKINVASIEPIIDRLAYIDLDLKPNFRFLISKGLEKKSEQFRVFLANLKQEEKIAIYGRLSSNLLVIILEEEITNHISIEYKSKPGYSFSFNFDGYLILDLAASNSLNVKLHISQFKSEIKRISNSVGLLGKDKIFLEVYCIDGNVVRSLNIENVKNILKQDLLASDILFKVNLNFSKDLAHMITIGGEVMFVYLYKEENI